MQLVVGAGLGIALLAGCGNDDDKSAQDKYCEAGQSLESSVLALGNVDLIAEGTDALEPALGAVVDDVKELRDTASDAATDDVNALQESLDNLGSAISGLGDEVTAENVSTLATEVQNVSTSAQAVYGTLSDCP